MNRFEIMDNWWDSLIWCPSQCELRIRYNNKNYILYLRWRWDDPWTAALIPVNDSFEMHQEAGEWIYLDIPYFTDEELDECKEASITAAKHYLMNA